MVERRSMLRIEVVGKPPMLGLTIHRVVDESGRVLYPTRISGDTLMACQRYIERHQSERGARA
jgi:hypothetical protein